MLDIASKEAFHPSNSLNPLVVAQVVLPIHRVPKWFSSEKIYDGSKMMSYYSPFATSRFEHFPPLGPNCSMVLSACRRSTWSPPSSNQLTIINVSCSTLTRVKAPQRQGHPQQCCLLPRASHPVKGPNFCVFWQGTSDGQHSFPRKPP